MWTSELPTNPLRGKALMLSQSSFLVKVKFLTPELSSLQIKSETLVDSIELNLFTLVFSIALEQFTTVKSTT